MEKSNLKTLNTEILRLIGDCNDAELLNNPNTEILLPHFSCQSLRHTFTTRMCDCRRKCKGHPGDIWICGYFYNAEHICGCHKGF